MHYLRRAYHGAGLGLGLGVCTSAYYAGRAGHFHEEYKFLRLNKRKQATICVGSSLSGALIASGTCLRPTCPWLRISIIPLVSMVSLCYWIGYKRNESTESLAKAASGGYAWMDVDYELESVIERAIREERKTETEEIQWRDRHPREIIISQRNDVIVRERWRERECVSV